jgi:hypothetical protein
MAKSQHVSCLLAMRKAVVWLPQVAWGFPANRSGCHRLKSIGWEDDKALELEGTRRVTKGGEAQLVCSGSCGHLSKSPACTQKDIHWEPPMGLR